MEKVSWIKLGFSYPDAQPIPWAVTSFCMQFENQNNMLMMEQGSCEIYQGSILSLPSA